MIVSIERVSLKIIIIINIEHLITQILDYYGWRALE
jgi:uncharacterized protein (DUF2132 family)